MDIVQIRNFRDFLLLYNQISETCFKKCAYNFLSRDLCHEEELCVKNCTEKFIHVNHKVMQVYMEVQPILIRRRMEEINSAQAALEAKAATEAQAQQGQKTEVTEITEKTV